jgi:teichuronic acid biosynthesis glycosyltransferase TuaH
MRILYLIHTDWCWIKQRSQFLAEELAKKNDIFVVTKFSPRRTNLVVSKRPSYCISLPFLPFQIRSLRVLARIDEVIFASIFKRWNVIRQFDLIIVTHPLLARYAMWHANMIYDLHDDNANFYPVESFLHEYIRKRNKEALHKARLVVFSSSYLQTKFTAETQCSTIVRNGHNISLRPKKSFSPTPDIAKKIFYFGTVSSWFDQRLLLHSLERAIRVEYHVIGPIDISRVAHKRIKWYGPLPHLTMLNLCSDADAFVMPFRITPLIKGVDPVKLYEYIAFGQPIITMYYSEVARFAPFVYFYHNVDEYHTLIKRLEVNDLPPKGEKKQVEDFLHNSSWSVRAREMIDGIRKRIQQ